MRKPLRLPKFSPPQVRRLSEKGRTLHALVSDNPLSYEVGLGGFDAKGNCTQSSRACRRSRVTPQGRSESNWPQDCRDILNAVLKRNPMIVPTAPVRKITNACDIWTDQTRNRTSTTVEFCIAKMMPNRIRTPPRISLNLVVMVSWFSPSSWEVTRRIVKAQAFTLYGLRKFDSRPGSYPARVSSTRVSIEPGVLTRPA
jgi:hypothetical protein